MNTLLLVQTNALAYVLNGHELTKEDFCLLLEIIGFDACRDLPYGEFWQRSLESLSMVPEDEFYEVFSKFVAYTPLERDIWRQLVTTQRFVVVENFSSN